MSLSRAILRLTAVRAIAGATLAEGRVFNSDLNPLDQRISADKLPMVVVYTDDHQDDTTGRGDMALGSGTVDLVFEIAIAGAVTIAGTDDNDEEVAMSIGETDAGMEFTLDLLERQILAALTTAEGQWPMLWRLFCTRIMRRVSRRGGSSENGARFAARQIVLTCETLIEPPPGVIFAEGDAWSQIIDAAAGDASLAPLAPILRAELRGQPVADWRQAARSLGVSLDVDIGLGGPMGGGEDPAALEEGEVTGTVTTGGSLSDA